MSTTLRLLLIAAICIFNVNAEIKTTDATGEGEGSGDGIVGVVAKKTASVGDTLKGASSMKLADVSDISIGDKLTIGTKPTQETLEVKTVVVSRRSRRAATPGVVTFTGETKFAHAEGAAIAWTVAKTAPKSSAVTTTVGVGIFAMVAALF